jgi:hypothetical protein
MVWRQSFSKSKSPSFLPFEWLFGGLRNRDFTARLFSNAERSGSRRTSRSPWADHIRQICRMSQYQEIAHHKSTGSTPTTGSAIVETGSAFQLQLGVTAPFCDIWPRRSLLRWKLYHYNLAKSRVHHDGNAAGPHFYYVPRLGAKCCHIDRVASYRSHRPYIVDYTRNSAP